ncbi:MAG: AMMECR1 domain-containing protein [Candidatus Altiarchaeales archaeon WOR_SM1_86-2]|nr:MAG: AMMECR1 domain-containing protein [Candidatus Altiarchaeales archaeon WOR_SM1_86-2]ODS39871.1 MAG: AMMECR1 domain-containing protein [Candidatus Altiarchaeales archaeon WOR_SM1_79]
MELTPEQGKLLVGLARSVIEEYFGAGKVEIPETLNDILRRKMGVFVSLHTYPGHDLRGCIGYAEPVMTLSRGLRNAALSAALNDPRFPRLKADELKNLVVEVSILTPPELMDVGKPEDYLNEIKIGRDGLIVEEGVFKGLLLPQVPVEWKWDVPKFLAHACMKAGLSANAWLDPEVRVYKFSGQVFSETVPEGEIIEKN